ncbi:MAG: outer membrane beta-barrel protein [Ignavibacteria bacterium]
MRKTFYSLLMAVCFISAWQGETQADWKFDPKLKLNQAKDYSKERISRDYNTAMKQHKRIAASFFGASIDFQVGYGTTSANVTEKSASDPVKTESKGGFNVGAILNLNLFNIINLSTGIDFTKKNFGITLPYTNPLITGDSIVKTLNNNYLNIPMNVTFGGMVTDKVGFTFTGGPYFGLLLNAENAVSGFKDFDFGINGMLTGKYYLNPFVAVILGTKAQYGGLNNLLSTSSVDKLHTVNWGGFTGVSVGF